ncbi:O-antigen ligase family protein [Patescibacteria group bacterium]|nr:O-antigen ligase family protein [Patescibacteria group bacterium]
MHFTFRISWSWILLFLFIVNAGVITFLNGNLILFGFFALRILEAIIIYLLIVDQLLPPKTIIKILLAAASLQIIWGWMQWKLNHSLGLTWLGEAVVSSETMGVAKTDVAEGIKQIRPYGSFLHPNILAAYLMVIMFISLSYLKKYRLLFWLIFLTGGIYFTHSRAAALITLVGFGAIILFSFLKEIKIKRWISLITLIILILGNVWFFQNSYAVKITDTSWQERLEQNVISHNMFWQNPIGVGTSNFTLEMENFSADKLMPWNFQPVHNTYFLALNETGAQGLILLLIAIAIIFYRYWKTPPDGFLGDSNFIPLLVLVLIAPFDHFLWDSFIGIILIAITIGFFRTNINPESIESNL